MHLPPGMNLIPGAAPRFPMAPILPSVKLLPESNTLYVNNLNEKIKE
jgi:hypothetical protein